MSYLRSHRRTVSPISDFLNPNQQRAWKVFIATIALATLPGFAQDQRQAGDEPPSPASSQADTQPSTITIPAGTRLALVLTHPIQSRHIRRGDDIYAQTTSPVDSGQQVVIPSNTFVQGKVDKLEWRAGRAEFHLQSMTITFSDGYVVPIPGPMTLVSDEGYAIKDPGSGRSVGALALPAAGVGLGALIGHAAANSQPSTLTASNPPGCTGPPPGCVSSSMSVPGSTAKGTMIGAAVGGAVGGVASIALLFGAHHFYLDVWSPVEMVLEHPVTMAQNEVTRAVRESAEHPVPTPPRAARRLPPPPPDMPANHGTCYPPGTPPTVIPGAPGLDGLPAPPTVIPGTPPTPGTPYPCL